MFVKWVWMTCESVLRRGVAGAAGSSSRSSSRTDLSAHFQQPIASQLVFHSFNNIQRKREDRRGWSRSLGATIGTTTTTHHHNYPPPNSYRWKGGGRKEGRKNLRKLSHTHIHTHLENTNRKINNLYYGLVLPPTRLGHAQLINVWKRANSPGKQ